MNAGSFISKIAIVVPFLFLCFASLGQNLDIDSTRVTPVDEEQLELEHSPRKATLLSTALPGLGQAYNKKYWKIPLIYAGFGTIGYFIHWNNGNYSVMRQAYKDFTDDNPETNSHLELDGAQYYDLTREPGITNFKTAVLKQQDYFRRNRDLLIISMVGFYGLQIIDASVDAHFFDFDISEDLTMNWQPTMNLLNNQPLYGFNCTFTF